MKGVPIKFKGESALGTIYGYYVKREGKTYIYNEIGAGVTVDENSVAQLIGYDDNGNEIYEGDELIYIDNDKDIEYNKLKKAFFSKVTVQAALKNDVVCLVPDERNKQKIFLTPEQQLERNAKFFIETFKLKQ